MTVTLLRVLIVQTTLFLAHSIASVGVTNPNVQFWVSMSFTVAVLVTGGYGLWMTRSKTHPSAVRARIREGLDRGRRINT